LAEAVRVRIHRHRGVVLLELPEEFAERAGIRGGSEALAWTEDGRIIVEPQWARDEALRLAIEGEKIGHIEPEELEEESLREQRRLAEEDSPRGTA